MEGGGGAILGTGLLVAGGPVEGSPWVSGVEVMEEEAEEMRGWMKDWQVVMKKSMIWSGEGLDGSPWYGGEEGLRGKPSPHNSETLSVRSSTNFSREAPLWWWCVCAT